jgi:CRP/FNR family cyclic AMP-dependent transcriptional regulator
MVRSADGGELTLAVLQPGDVFGELAAVDNGPRSADAETLEESRLLLIPREIVQDVCFRVPGVALAKSVTATLRRLTESTSDLVFLDLPHRVAKVLLGAVPL